MFTLLLDLHSWLRWAVVITGIMATRAAMSDRWRGETWSIAFVSTLDLQMLIGLLLYLVFSPNMAAIRGDFGAAMHDPAARFWAVEHLGSMLLAVMLAHAGRVFSRKAKATGERSTKVLVCFALALLLIIVATPWPGLPNGRPLFRL